MWPAGPGGGRGHPMQKRNAPPETGPKLLFPSVDTEIFKDCPCDPRRHKHTDIFSISRFQSISRNIEMLSASPGYTQTF